MVCVIVPTVASLFSNEITVDVLAVFARSNTSEAAPAEKFGLIVNPPAPPLVDVPTKNLPPESILIRSVGELAPSAVVENTSLAGMSLAPGVPSTAAKMEAAGM